MRVLIIQIKNSDTVLVMGMHFVSVVEVLVPKSVASNGRILITAVTVYTVKDAWVGHGIGKVLGVSAKAFSQWSECTISEANAQNYQFIYCC